MSQKVKISKRDLDARKKDFKQVDAGYTQYEMLLEAKRCLQCKVPLCVSGCPVEIDIPEFIKHLAKNNPEESIKILNQKNNLSAVCGRVCPQENQCEKSCILARKGKGISIGLLERYAADVTAKNDDYSMVIKKNTDVTSKNNIKVAIIGSGPAGLTCSGDLLKVGYDVTVYESLHDIGGVLRYGIPEFRLPKEVLDMEINKLKRLGMRVVLNTLVGRTKTIQDLLDEGHKAVFIAVGAGLPVLSKVIGENLNHIYYSNEFLVRINLMSSFNFPNNDTPIYKGKNVVVIGGGNTAMDSARTAIRLGAESVKLIYRRTENDMPARKKERIYAKEEGVEFITLTNPIKFIGNERGFVRAIECVKMSLDEYDNSKKRHVYEIVRSNFLVETDMVILALGLHPNPVLVSLTEGLITDNNGYLIVDDNYMTPIRGVFAGGDIVGGSTVIEAMGMGKRAARAIINYFKTNLG